VTHNQGRLAIKGGLQSSKYGTSVVAWHHLLIRNLFNWDIWCIGTEGVMLMA